MEEKSFDGIKVLKAFGKSFIIEMIISILGAFILSVVLCKTNVSDSIMGNVIIGISAFSIGIGGLLSSKKIKMKGILCGALQGIFYMGILYLISSIVSHSFVLGLESIIMMVIGIICRRCWRNYWSKFKIKK